MGAPSDDWMQQRPLTPPSELFQRPPQQIVVQLENPFKVAVTALADRYGWELIGGLAIVGAITLVVLRKTLVKAAKEAVKRWGSE